MLARRDLVTFKCQMTEAEAKKSTLPSQAGEKGAAVPAGPRRCRASTGRAGDAHARQEWVGGTARPRCLGTRGGRGRCIAQQNPAEHGREQGAERRCARAQRPRRRTVGRRGELARVTVSAFGTVKCLPAFPPRLPALSRVPRDSVARVLMG